MGLFGNGKIEAEAQSISQAEDTVDKSAPGNRQAAVEKLLKAVADVSFEDQKAVFARVQSLDKKNHIGSKLSFVDDMFYDSELRVDKGLEAEMILEAEARVNQTPSSQPAERLQAITRLRDDIKAVPAPDQLPVLELVEAGDKSRGTESLLYQSEDSNGHKFMDLSTATHVQLEDASLLTALPEAEAEAGKIAAEIRKTGLIGSEKDNFKADLRKAATLDNAQHFVDMINDKLAGKGHLQLNGSGADDPDSGKEGFHVWLVKPGDPWYRATDQLTVPADNQASTKSGSADGCSDSSAKKPGAMQWAMHPIDTWNDQQNNQKLAEKASAEASTVERAEQDVRNSSHDPVEHMKAINSLQKALHDVAYGDQMAVYTRVAAADKAAQQEFLLAPSALCEMSLSDRLTEQYQKDDASVRNHTLLVAFPNAEQEAARIADKINRTGTLGDSNDQAEIRAAFAMAKVEPSTFNDMINERLKQLNKDPKTQYLLTYGQQIGQDANFATGKLTTTVNGPSVELYRGPEGDSPLLGELAVGTD